MLKMSLRIYSVCLTEVYNERKFMNEDTKPTTGMPAPTTSVETKPADQKPAAPTTAK